MNQQKPTTTPSTDSKPGLRDRVKQSNITSKAKNIAAVVGVVTVVGVVAATVTKKKSAKVNVTLPDVDVTTDAS